MLEGELKFCECRSGDSAALYFEEIDRIETNRRALFELPFDVMDVLDHEEDEDVFLCNEASEGEKYKTPWRPLVCYSPSESDSGSIEWRVERSSERAYDAYERLV